MAACEKAGREPIPFTVMTGCLVASDQAELEARERELVAWTGEGTSDTWLAGTVEQVVEQIKRYEEAGVERVYLQQLLHRDLAMTELIGRELVPAVA